MGKVLIVSSGSIGVGKSTVVINVGINLCNHNKRVLIIDGSFTLSSSLNLGFANTCQYSLIDIIENKINRWQATTAIGNCDNLHIISTANCEKLSVQAFKLFCDNSKRIYDYVIIDCPSGVGWEFCRCAAPCDDAYIIVTQNELNVLSAKIVLAALKIYDVTPKIIINKVTREGLNCKHLKCGDGFNQYSISEIGKSTALQIAGILPASKMAAECFSLNSDVEKLHILEAFKLLSKNIINNESKLYEFEEKKQGVLEKIISKFKAS